ncbi:hypothetical protein SteCoe_35027 [Stentor coeruleus]|uniref:MORN repeat protein n=1 Tax=Stentor coeruleus TaxID=5963 RepID=A0A1R2AT90_9CILI|nr:hypothetical protein SteCoe_35027 [Stentor coeruleus]
MGNSETRPPGTISFEKIGKNTYKVFSINSETYIGELIKGKRSGMGELTTESGHVYTGEWKDDLMSGQGIYKYNNGDIYKGGWVYNQRHGYGEFTTDKLGIYKGNWENDHQKGQGISEYKNGTVYNGNWTEGKMEGYGKMIWKQGFTYEGEFKKNFTSNKGKCSTPSGDVYFAVEYLPTFKLLGRIFLPEGERFPSEKSLRFNCLIITEDWNIFEGWLKFAEKEHKLVLEGRYEKSDLTSYLIGEGILNFPDTSYIKGFFKNYLRVVGYGVSYLHDKEIYKGIFDYGYKHNFGICEYKDGGVYKDSKNSLGTMVYANGDIFKGMWIRDEKLSGDMKFKNGDTFNGIFQSPNGLKGIYVYINGDIYKGEMIGLLKEGNGIMYYTDGSTYKGNWKQDLKHGFGVLTLKTGWYYEGSWSQGKIEGIGITSEDSLKLFNFKNNEILSEFIPPSIESYKGNYLEGILKHGNGTYTYANGDIYTGEWNENKKHGIGEMIWANGQKYNGYWEFDEIKGQGTMQLTDGTKYHGGFIKGLYNGKGKLLMPDGNTISGEWENGEIIQKNLEYSYNDGKNYIGTMTDFIWHGYGTLNYPGGLNYIGNFNSGVYHGKGCEDNQNEKYDGEWVEGIKHGKGKYQDKYGNLYDGNWDMGKKQGEFIINFKTKEKIIQNFDNDFPIGQGILVISQLNNENKDPKSQEKNLNVEWDSEEIQGIIKKTKKLRKYGKIRTEEDN